MKTYCIGDIHGNYKALKDVLEMSNFNYENDTLISLGDIVDGYPDTFECVEELLKIKNLIIVHSNHDYWFREWILKGVHPVTWRQGGYNTALSYCKNLSTEEKQLNVVPITSMFFETSNDGGYTTNLIPDDLPESHKKFFIDRPFYYVDEQNRLFVHGGINRHYEIDNDLFNDGETVLIWDRDFWQSALGYEAMSKGKGFDKERYPFKIKDGFKEVYLGHSSTLMWDTDYPMRAGNVYNLDTGAGFKGRLSVMNVDTKQVYQSKKGEEYYGNFSTRK
jgi:serine/threonine protein phosphatase 1